MTRTFPTVVSRIALVFFSDSPRTLPTKSDGFLRTTVRQFTQSISHI